MPGLCYARYLSEVPPWGGTIVSPFLQTQTMETQEVWSLPQVYQLAMEALGSSSVLSPEPLTVICMVSLQGFLQKTERTSTHLQ